MLDFRRSSRVLGIVLLVLGGSQITFSQISPPGLDGAKGSAWMAVGFSQDIGSRWTLIAFVGASSQSDPVNFGFFKKPGIKVISQETYYKFNSHWQLALGTSFRSSAFYEEAAPYSPADPPWKDEIRYYARLFYRHQQGRWSFAYSFRPELRTFYTTDGASWSPTPVQLRFRWKAQAIYALNNTQTNSVMVANEFLFATNEQTDGWSRLQFTEDRLSTYFRHRIKKPDLMVDVGLMHEFWHDADLHYTLYLAADFIFRDPFGKHK